MSRSGYSDDDENIGLWRGAVHRAINGKRGQEFLRDMLAALDALPTKRLVAHSFEETDGEVCALGSVGKARGLDMKPFQSNEYENAPHRTIAKGFGIAKAMAQEIMFENDEGSLYQETPEQRFTRIRAWVVENIVEQK